MGIALGAKVTRKAGYYSRGAVMHLLRNWAHFYQTGRMAPVSHSIPTGYLDLADGRAPGVPECAPFESASRLYADLTNAVIRVSRDEQDMLILHYREDTTYDKIAADKHLSKETISARLKSGRRQLYAIMCDPRKGT